MKTITFATTQINLINCVEFLSTINGEHTLFLMADSPSRYRQLKKLLSTPAYNRIFSKILCRPRTNSRIVNFILTNLYLLELRLNSCYSSYDVVVTGNYKNFGSRLTYRQLSKKNKSCSFVVCDDGMATSAIAKARIDEIKNRKPSIFVTNRLLRIIHRRNLDSFIPEALLFYTSYNISTVNDDIVIKNDYKYLKAHLSDFNIEENVFNCKSILLGQPLYCKGFVTANCYASKLLHYSATVQEKVVYYAHPEETEKEWSLLGVSSKYTYVNNFLPFEIVSTILPPGCRVVSFFSSAIMNLRTMNPALIPECITLSEDELIDKKSYFSLRNDYISYKQANVKFYEFD